MPPDQFTPEFVGLSPKSNLPKVGWGKVVRTMRFPDPPPTGSAEYCDFRYSHASQTNSTCTWSSLGQV
jgi:hypothetical protein